MTLSPSVESQKYIEQVADEALTQLDVIAAVAKKNLQEVSLTTDALAIVNTMTSGAVLQNLEDISAANREGYRVLASEPSIARVVVADEDGRARTYYICRATPVSGVSNLASYRAPVGRLASLAIGTEFVLPDGSVVEVLERARLRPTLKVDEWDSQDTVLEAKGHGPFTVESLRALLECSDNLSSGEDILAQLLAEEISNTNVVEGLRRSVITKMGLRDQPVLDQYQDEIFRLPLNKRLLILGPPGTGKTTTLIRRLGQKLDVEFLEESEQHLVEAAAAGQGVAHANSWLMFTPTELLKQYLKEAFAREGVAASDYRIRTWQDYRRELSRNAFGILRTSSGSGYFVMKEDLNSLTSSAIERPIDWYNDFDKCQRKAFVAELVDAATFLQGNILSSSLGAELLTATGRVRDVGLAATFATYAKMQPAVQSLVSGLKTASDRIIDSALNLQLKQNRDLLLELAAVLDSLQQVPMATVEDQDDLDSDDEEDSATPRTALAIALNAYKQAIRADARAFASNRSVTKSSRNGKILEWLGDRGLAQADRAEVGVNLLVQANARRFVSPVKRYLDGVPRRYRTFRRERQQASAWYRAEGYEVRDVHPLELDIMLLAILRSAGDLLGRPAVLRDIDSPAWSALKPVLGYYRNQILVDEATDFSPVQLACMAALANPRLRSFFACGDFNQRLTIWGARSEADMKWIFSDIDIKEVTVSYRQSRQLHELACAIVRAVGGSEKQASLPLNMDSAGVPPALLEGAATLATVVPWLADRIREIERFVGQLPSIAIFVNAEGEVEPLTEALNAALVEHNIPVSACREGQAVGYESNVRVFDIQHIKGLEFEAVFFVGIDLLATQNPDLFDKYLYVGATRAATYLGVTCYGRLPARAEVLRDHFCSDWQKIN